MNILVSSAFANESFNEGEIFYVTEDIEALLQKPSITEKEVEA